MDFEENAQNEEILTNGECVAEAANSLPEWQIFTERLRTAREKAGLTLQALAEKLSVDMSTVSRWESGVREPGLKTVSDIAAILNVPTDYLLGLTDSDGTVQSANDRAKAILAKARDQGDEQALFFEMTFGRYLKLNSLLEKIKAEIDDRGVLISKKNVKGDENLISNPALKDYVAVNAQANETGKQLIGFVKEPLEDDSEEDELTKFLNRRRGR